MVNIVTKRKSKSAIFFGKLKEYIVQIPKEHKGFMKQTFMLAKEDLLKTYKGAVIGPLCSSFLYIGLHFRYSEVLRMAIPRWVLNTFFLSWQALCPGSL